MRRFEQICTEIYCLLFSNLFWTQTQEAHAETMQYANGNEENVKDRIIPVRYLGPYA